jgi:hypothetical protein
MPFRPLLPGLVKVIAVVRQPFPLDPLVIMRFRLQVFKPGQSSVVIQRPFTNRAARTIALTLAIASGTVRRPNPHDGHNHSRCAGSRRSRSSAIRASSSDDWMRGVFTSTMPAATSSQFVR